MGIDLGVIKDRQRALEDYLKAIYRLEELMGIAKTTYLAKELGVTPATVTKMMSKLARDGYIVWEPYKGAKLSNKGRILAENIVRKHRIAEYFFYKILKLDLLKSHIYAHMLEHLPDEVFDRLYEFLNKPSTCPHGNPIPGAVPPREVIESKTIDSFNTNDKVRITRILCILEHKILEHLLSLGISVNTEICIKEKKESEYVVVEVDKREISISYPLIKVLRGIKVGNC